MKNITVMYGPQEATYDFPDQFNVGQVIRDPRVKATLGYGDNITVLEDGASMPLESFAEDGTTLTVETAANRKAQLLAA